MSVLVLGIQDRGEPMQDCETRIRDGSVVDLARANVLLKHCLSAAPRIYPTRLIEAYSKHLGPVVLRGFLESGGHLIVAEHDRHVVGFSCGVPDSAISAFGTYYGAWVAVDPNFRLQGIGLRLLRAIEARAFAEGCHKFYVLVQTDNEPAMRLFGRGGFVTEGVLRRHWNNYDFYFMAHFADEIIRA